MRCTDCHKTIRPVFGVDIDGTLAMYHAAVYDFTATYYDRVMLPAIEEYDGSVPFRDFLGLSQGDHRAMKLAFRQGGNKRWLKTYPHVHTFMDEIRNGLEAEVWVATTRPWQSLSNIDMDTQEWLRRNGIQVDGLLYGEDKYEQLIEAVGKDRIVGVFDDLPEQIVKATTLGLPFFQVHRPHNSSTRFTPGGTLVSALQWAAKQIDEWSHR